MKIRILFISLILVSSVLVACQPAPMKTVEPVSTSPSPQQTEPGAPQANPPATLDPAVAYPAPLQTSPTVEPTVVVLQPGTPLYPDLADGSDILWQQVEMMARNGEVARLIVFESTLVTVVLKDGRTLRSGVDRLDVVPQMIESCGEACQDITVENG